MSNTERIRAVSLALLIVTSSIVVGVGSLSGRASANGSSSENVSVSVTKTEVKSGGVTYYEVTVENTGSQQTTYTIAPAESPSDWSVSDNDWDLNGHKQVTLDSGQSSTVTFKVTSGSTSKTGYVTFDVYHRSCSWGICTAKDHEVNSATGSHTVDADGPSISNVHAEYDGTQVTVYADVADASGLSTVDVTYDLGLTHGGTTVQMSHVSGNTYSATFDLSWGESFDYDIYAEDGLGNSHETSNYQGQVPTDSNSPTISNVDVSYNGKEVIVTADVSDDVSGVNPSTVTLTYDTGWANFGGTAVQMSHVGGTTYRGSFTLDYGQRFEYKVTASDQAGNNGGSGTSEGEVPRGTTVFEISNNDDEDKQATLYVDGAEKKTVSVPAGQTATASVKADPVTHDVTVKWSEQDRGGQTYSDRETVSVPQSRSSTASFTIGKRLSPKIKLQCANDCNFGTYNPETETPTVKVWVRNVGGGSMDWEVVSSGLTVVEKGSNYVIVKPMEGEAGKFTRTLDIMVMNERYEGQGHDQVSISGKATIEPTKPNVTFSYYPAEIRPGLEGEFAATVRSGDAGTPDQPSPAPATDHVVTWYVDGEQVAQGTPEQDTSLGARDVMKKVLDEPGEHTVKVVAKDPNTGKTDSTTRTFHVKTVDGKIVGYESPATDAPYRLDKWYTVTVVVKNTGDFPHTFTVEAPEMSGRETKDPDNRKNVTLEAGATGTVTFQQRWYGTYTQTRAFEHRLIKDVATDRAETVVDNASVTLSEPANGEIVLEPHTGDGKAADITITLTNKSSGEVVLQKTIPNATLGIDAKRYDIRAGTYELKASADGYITRTRTVTVEADKETHLRPTLAPKGVDAKIVDGSFSVQEGPYKVGDYVKATVTVKNTGDKTWEFFVGFSVRPNGTTKTYSQAGQTGNFVELAPGEQKTVTVKWRVGQSVESGSYHAIAAVWYGYPEDGAAKIDDTGWQKSQFEVLKSAETTSVKYQGETYLVEIRTDDTVAVYNQNRELVSEQKAKAVLQYKVFRNLSVDDPSGNWWSTVNETDGMKYYYWAAHLNQAGLTALKAYANIQFGGYTDAVGEYIELTKQATRLMSEQSGGGYGTQLHQYSTWVSKTHEAYSSPKDSAKFIADYATIVSDAYRLKRTSDQADTMADAIRMAETTQDGSKLTDTATGLVISTLSMPIDDVNAGLRVTSQQAFLMSHWGKSSKPVLFMLEQLEEKRRKGTISPAEMKLYYILQIRFVRSQVVLWQQMAELQREGESASIAFDAISDFQGADADEWENLSKDMEYLAGLKAEMMARYLNRSDRLINNSVNVHEDPQTKSLWTSEPMVVSTPGWVEPGEELTIHVESRGKPVINAQVTIGDKVVETNRHGNATVTMWERGSYRVTIQKEGFESGKTVVQVRDPVVASRAFSDVSFGKVEGEPTTSGKTSLNNSGETPIEIASVSSKHPAVSASVVEETAAPGENVSVAVDVDWSMVDEGSFVANVTVDWKNPDGTTSFLVSGTHVVSTGTVTIETVPQGAQVSVDGEPRGTAPVTVELSSGSHVITTTAAGYTTNTTTVTVEPDSQTTKVVELASRQPDVALDLGQTRVDGTQVTLPVTVTNTGSGSGQVTVLARTDGTTLEQRTVSLGAGETRTFPLSGTLSEGVHTVTVEARRDGTVVASTTTEVSAGSTSSPPELTIEDPTEANPRTVEGAGDQFPVVATVQFESGLSERELRSTLRQADLQGTVRVGDRKAGFIDVHVERMGKSDGRWTVTLVGTASAPDHAPGTYDISVEFVLPNLCEAGACTMQVREVTDTAPGAVIYRGDSLTPRIEVNVSRPQVGDDVKFNASGTTAPQGRSITYNWDLDGDGTFDDATGVTAIRSFETAGTHEVGLKVSDGQSTATTSVSISVTGADEQNHGPTASVEPNTTSVVPGQTVQFDATGSTDPDGDALTYRWDFDGDGSTDATGETVAHTFDATGDHTVTLNVSDGTASATTATTVSVHEQTGTPKATVSVGDGSTTAATNGTTTVTVFVDAGQEGVGAYGLNLSIADTSTARITNVSVLGDPGQVDTAVAQDRSTAMFDVALAEYAGPGRVAVATVTLTGEAAGNTSLNVTVEALGTTGTDGSVEDYNVTATTNATVEVVDVDPVGSFENPPTDPDNDGKFEDVNGNGKFTLVDVQALFAHRDDGEVQARPELFDFTGNGQVDVVDVQALFQEAVDDD